MDMSKYRELQRKRKEDVEIEQTEEDIQQEIRIEIHEEGTVVRRC